MPASMHSTPELYILSLIVFILSPVFQLGKGLIVNFYVCRHDKTGFVLTVNACYRKEEIYIQRNNIICYC